MEGKSYQEIITHLFTNMDNALQKVNLEVKDSATGIGLYTKIPRTSGKILFVEKTKLKKEINFDTFMRLCPRNETDAKIWKNKNKGNPINFKFHKAMLQMWSNHLAAKSRSQSGMSAEDEKGIEVPVNPEEELEEEVAGQEVLDKRHDPVTYNALYTKIGMNAFANDKVGPCVGDVISTINHADNPNVIQFQYTLNGINYIAAIALRDIEVGEELTISYGVIKPNNNWGIPASHA
jgi:hypothetical protein